MVRVAFPSQSPLPFFFLPPTLPLFSLYLIPPKICQWLGKSWSSQLPALTAFVLSNHSAEWNLDGIISWWISWLFTFSPVILSSRQLISHPDIQDFTLMYYFWNLVFFPIYKYILEVLNTNPNLETVRFLEDGVDCVSLTIRETK